MKKIILVVFFYSLALTLNGQNLAAGKKCLLSEQPNYPLSAGESGSDNLTDGRFTSGHFWMQPSTLGWQAKSSIDITIDLEKEAGIDAVNFRTARGKEADVYFPEHIFAFLTNDMKGFEYVGDIANTKNNFEGQYRVETFSLSKINKSARYVVLKIIPKGYYLFVDEIEVFKGKANALTNKLIALSDFDKKVFELQNLQYQRKNLKEDIKKVFGTLPQKNISIVKEIRYFNTVLDRKDVNTEDLKMISSRIGSYHAKKINDLYKKTFLVEKINPWAVLSNLHQPIKDERALYENFSLILKGVSYGAFVITNTSNVIQEFKFDVKKTNDNCLINLYNVSKVTTKEMVVVSDPIIPMSKSVDLASGESHMVIYKVTGEKIGSNSSVISVITPSETTKIFIGTKIKDISTSNQIPDLNAVNWGYLNYNMISNVKKEAVEDQISHHINTIVVPSHIIPRPGDYNFNSLITYLSNFPEVKNILLFSNYSYAENDHINKNITFLSLEWKSSFLIWYSALIKEVTKVNSGKIYLYPFDEVEENDIKKFIDFSIWAKENVKGLNLFATFNKKKTADALIPYVDIAQVLGDLNYKAEKTIPNQEIWMYRTNNNSRALSPYSYYRLMAWEAFLNDYQGIGFWNYADVGRQKFNFVDNNYLQWKDDYSVIYNNREGGLLSSRRWEAFKLGIEEYRLLYLYKRKFGISKAKEKVKAVLADRSDVSKADLVIGEILNQL